MPIPTRKSSSRYIPGRVYDVTGGVTQSDFESDYAMSLPFEDGFFKDPGATNKCIVVGNLSSRPLVAVLTGEEEFNPIYGNERWNEKEKQAVRIDPGRTTHFPLHDTCYIVTVEEFVVGEFGKKYRETGLGKKLSELANRTITVFDGVHTGSLDIRVNANGDLDNYFELLNASSRPIRVSIVVEDTAYQKEAEMIRREKLSRLPDYGGKKVEQEIVYPGGKLCYRHPHKQYVLRFLDPANTRGQQRMFAIPPVQDYVENTKQYATIGQTVIAFNMDDHNGAIDSATYNTSELRMVKDDIVVTNSS